jgi:hypothetical protein
MTKGDDIEVEEEEEKVEAAEEEEARERPLLSMRVRTCMRV